MELRLLRNPFRSLCSWRNLTYACYAERQSNGLVNVQCWTNARHARRVIKNFVRPIEAE